MIRIADLVADARASVGSSDLERARSFAEIALNGARDVEDLNRLLRLIPALWGAEDCLARYAAIERRLDESKGLMQSSDLIAYHALKLRLKIATREYAGYISSMENLMTIVEAENIPKVFTSVYSKLKTIPFPNLQEEKVFIIGLSRTGTTSLNSALEHLGYEAAHFFNKLTGSPIKIDDVDLFDAISDTPACVLFERLYFRYPNAKFIYSYRPIENWVKSIRQLMKLIRGTDDIAQLRLQADFRSPAHKFQYHDFDSELYLNFDSFQQAFLAYDRRVSDFFEGKAEKKLFRIDIESNDGWSSICDFLEKEIPQFPFPWQNSA